MRKITLVFALVLGATSCRIGGGSLKGDSVSTESTVATDTSLWVTNGLVESLKIDNGIAYLGGQFTAVGPRAGTGLRLVNGTNAVSGTSALVSGLATMPKVNAIVRAVVSDGSGGFYIGGDFTRVGSTSRGRLAHILSDGSLDSSWDPQLNGTVTALVLDSANGLLYVGGSFTTVESGSVTRNYLAAIQTSDGTATSWNPDPNSTVYSLEYDSANSLIYAAGLFTTLQGGVVTRNYLAAIQASDGTATAWNPAPNFNVRTIALDETNGILYAGGTFTTVNGGSATRRYLAALQTSDAAATAWNPDPNSVVLQIRHDSTNGLIYAVGNFTSLAAASVTRRYVAAIQTSDGAATSWDPNPNNSIASLDLDLSNGLVYVGGSFATIGGANRNRLAAIQTSDGTATSWNPDVNGVVYGIAASSSGNSVYAGGDFSSLGVQTRRYLAAFDLATGEVTSWDPFLNGSVYDLQIDSANELVYAAGVFTTTAVGTVTRNRMAAFRMSDGTATSWHPNFNSVVNSIAFDSDNGLIYAGGSFTTVEGGSVTRNYLAAIQASDGTATAWDPNASSTVQTVELDSANGLLYVGGFFTSLNGGAASRNRLAAVQLSDGAATAWNPNVNNIVYCMALDSTNGLLYIGGDFTSVQGGLTTRNRLAAIQTSDGAPSSWDPSANLTVYALALDSANGLVFAGGYFTTLASGATSRNRLASIQTSDGLANSWDPNIYAPNNPHIKDIVVDSSSRSVYVGGAMTNIGTDIGGNWGRVSY